MLKWQAVIMKSSRCMSKLKFGHDKRFVWCICTSIAASEWCRGNGLDSYQRPVVHLQSICVLNSIQSSSKYLATVNWSEVGIYCNPLLLAEYSCNFPRSPHSSSWIRNIIGGSPPANMYEAKFHEYQPIHFYFIESGLEACQGCQIASLGTPDEMRNFLLSATEMSDKLYYICFNTNGLLFCLFV